ncbi:MAG: ATP-binding protein [Allobaculum sp.]|nr:ATP-binding protein [Allobaculum sp.]
MENSLILVQNQCILPELMILGPNGSGKSNLLKAISVSKAILQTSSTRMAESPIPGIQPYALT